MKLNFILTFLLLSFCVLFSAQAQGSKIGYVDRQYIRALLPEISKAQSDYSSTEKLIQNDSEKHYKQMEEKYAPLRKMKDTTGRADAQLVALEKESKNYYAQLEKKEKEASAKRSAAIAISEEKLEKAIQDVAKENKYSAVMDVGQVIYYDAADNLTSLVLRKLGILAK